jgi:DNA-binding beta-propeller fold protein YncE
MRDTIRLFLVTIAAVCLLAGCATHRTRAIDPVFYPPPPDAPRIQFLKTFSTSRDINPQGWFSQFILGPLSPRPIIKPYGITIHSNCIYVCDTMLGGLALLDLEKHTMDYFVPSGPGRLLKPINIAIDPDGTRYVADSERGQVLVFNPSGTLIGTVGKKAERRQKASERNAEPAPEKPVTEKKEPADPDITLPDMRPIDVLVNSNRLFVADLKGHCVRVFDKQTLAPVMTIPAGVSTNEEAKLLSPTNLAQDQQGRLYVCDTGAFRVKLYDTNGNFIRSFGRYGNRYGELARPKGVAVDREGRVYVADAQLDSIQAYDPDGQLLLAFGQPGTSPIPLVLPAKVAIDYDHIKYFQKYAAPGFSLDYLILVTSQYGERKVNVYGFGHSVKQDSP